MKKAVLIFIMIITIIKTIPTIYLSTQEQYTSVSVSGALKPLSSTPKTPPNESSGNITNQGLAVEDNGMIYYSDGINICSMDEDERAIIQIKENVYPLNIQVLDDKIYYIHGQTSEIYVINKDGTENKRVSKDKAYSLNVYKNRLYFIDRYNNLHITAMSLKGENKTIIEDVLAKDMMVYDDYIYYLTRNGNLGKVRIDGEDSRLIERDVMHFDVGKRGVYYTYDLRKEYREKGLYQLGFSDNLKSKLIQETPYNFNAHGDFIYYNHPVKMSLYSMLFDGTQKRQLTGANISNINIAGSYIYYKNLEDGKKIYRITESGKNRVALQGKIAITNVTDLTHELNELDGKEISPKLARAYYKGKEIIETIIEPSMADYEKVKVIHDYIINNTRYDIETADRFLRGEDSDANAFTASGVLINNKGVCQGYAEATQILLSLAGVPGELVIGYVDDGEGGYIPHMWNMVFIHNKCYMIDTTWDDPVGPEDQLIYDYFLVDSASLKKDHYWVEDEYPSCN